MRTCWGREWSLATEALPVDGDRMTALIHYERQRWKKINFFAKKPFPWSLFQHVQTQCMPSFIDLHTHATAGHVTSFAWSWNTSANSDRSLAWSYHTSSPHGDLRDRSRSRWNIQKHETFSGKPCTVFLDRTSALHALHLKTREQRTMHPRVIDRTALQAPGQHETLWWIPVDRDCSIALHCTSTGIRQ